jgi:hypothetical protein
VSAPEDLRTTPSYRVGQLEWMISWTVRTDRPRSPEELLQELRESWDAYCAEHGS